MVDYFATGISKRDGKLFIGEVQASSLAEIYGTPLYAYNEQRIRENYRNLRDPFAQEYGKEKVRIHYAAKANTNLSILKILKDEGSWIDAVSMGEVDACLKAGFPPEKILFTGTSITDETLEFLVEKKVMINIDSLSALERLLKLKPDIGFLSFRINPEIGAGHHEHVVTGGKNAKFGLWEENAKKAYKRAKEAGVKRFGIHAHIGTGIHESEPFMKEIENLVGIAGRIAREAGVQFEFIDFGGGYGVPYKPDEEGLDIPKLAKEAIAFFRQKLKENELGEPIFAIEPGRYLVCDAGIVLTRVNTVKQTPHKKIAAVDAGYQTLVRPMMYGAYHHIIVDGKLNAEKREKYDVAGPVCESGDLLAKERALPEIEEGDLLAVLDAGAYGFSMASNYNSFPFPAEVLVNGSRPAVIRERQEIEELYKRQKIANWLE